MPKKCKQCDAEFSPDFDTDRYCSSTCELDAAYEEGLAEGATFDPGVQETIVRARARRVRPEVQRAAVVLERCVLTLAAEIKAAVKEALEQARARERRLREALAAREPHRATGTDWLVCTLCNKPGPDVKQRPRTKLPRYLCDRCVREDK